MAWLVTLESVITLLEHIVLDLLDCVPHIHAVGHGSVEAQETFLAEVIGQIGLNLCKYIWKALQCLHH